LTSVKTLPIRLPYPDETAYKPSESLMRVFRFIVIGLLAFLSLAPAAQAADQPSLFVNLTTDDAHRARMALSFATNQIERQHPVTVFLNDRGVLIGSKAKTGDFEAQQKMLGVLMEKGAAILICPMCMKHYGVAEADVIDGVKVSNPDLVGQALFAEDAKTLTW
jgi:sulfur relay (sulfurtransferase) complex TusBCD TusD component (DsrE family)